MNQAAKPTRIRTRIGRPAHPESGTRLGQDSTRGNTGGSAAKGKFSRISAGHELTHLAGRNRQIKRSQIAQLSGAARKLAVRFVTLFNKYAE